MLVQIQVQFLAASSPLMLSPHFTSGASAKPQVAARSPVERRIDATTASPMMMLTTGTVVFTCFYQVFNELLVLV